MTEFSVEQRELLERYRENSRESYLTISPEDAAKVDDFFAVLRNGCSWVNPESLTASNIADILMLMKKMRIDFTKTDKGNVLEQLLDGMKSRFNGSEILECITQTIESDPLHVWWCFKNGLSSSECEIGKSIEIAVRNSYSEYYLTLFVLYYLPKMNPIDWTEVEQKIMQKYIVEILATICHVFRMYRHWSEENEQKVLCQILSITEKWGVNESLMKFFSELVSNTINPSNMVKFLPDITKLKYYKYHIGGIGRHLKDIIETLSFQALPMNIILEIFDTPECVMPTPRVFLKFAIKMYEVYGEQAYGILKYVDFSSLVSDEEEMFLEELSSRGLEEVRRYVEYWHKKVLHDAIRDNIEYFESGKTIASLRDDLNEMRKKVAEQKKTFEMTNKSIEEKGMKLDDQSREVEKSNRTMAMLDEDIKILDNEIEKINEEIKQLDQESRILMLKKELLDARKEKKQHESKLQALEQEHEAAKLKAEQDAAAKLKAEQDAAARAKAEQDAAARAKAEQDAAARAKAEQDAAARAKAEQDEAARAKAEPTTHKMGGDPKGAKDRIVTVDVYAMTDMTRILFRLEITLGGGGFGAGGLKTSDLKGEIAKIRQVKWDPKLDCMLLMTIEKNGPKTLDNNMLSSVFTDANKHPNFPNYVLYFHLYNGIPEAKAKSDYSAASVIIEWNNGAISPVGALIPKKGTATQAIEALRQFVNIPEGNHELMVTSSGKTTSCHGNDQYSLSFGAKLTLKIK